ncbi:MAG: CoA ester lyase [Alphaproteobacteria bacterium]
MTDNHTARPRRSALFMPGSNERALEKGRSVAADIIIMDLEDGVAPDAKGDARRGILAALADGGYGSRELVIRINGAGSGGHEDDIAAMAASGVAALLVPKVDDADTVRAVAALMAEAGAPDNVAIWAMIETAAGVLAASEIAGAHSRMGALLLGGADLSKDLGALHTPDRLPLLTSIQLCILAARAHGLAVLDSPFFDLSDDDGFKAACRQGREFGFDGKALLHPKTIAVANAAYSPSEDDIAHARRIIDIHADAIAKGQGVTLLDGKLVENLHVAEAKNLIAMADTIADIEAASES